MRSQSELQVAVCLCSQPPCWRAAYRLTPSILIRSKRINTTNAPRVRQLASSCSPASTRACSVWDSTTSDIFYSDRFDPETPLEETASALATAVQQGKALC